MAKITTGGEDFFVRTLPMQVPMQQPLLQMTFPGAGAISNRAWEEERLKGTGPGKMPFRYT